MFGQINKRLFYRKKHLGAPFLKERLQYLQFLKDRDRSLSTIRSAANYLLRIIEFLRLNIKRIVTPKEIEVAANAWARYQCNNPSKKQLFSHQSKVIFIRHATNWFKMIRYLEPPSKNVALFYEIFKYRSAIDRHLNAPLLKERIKYLQYWSENGAAKSSLKRIAEYLLLIIDYLGLDSKNRSIVPMAEVEKMALKWATTKNKYLRKLRKADFSERAKRRFIYDAITWLKMINRLEEAEIKSHPFSKQLSGYINYMRQEQGLSENTIYSRNSTLKNFFGLVWKEINSLHKLNILIIDKIIEHKRNVNKYSRLGIQDYASTIRSFLRFAEQNNWCHKGLAASIKTARVYKHESLPYSPPWDDVKKLLTKTEGDYPINIRDRAIIMLLAVYGLRRNEVVNLKLNDIDWKNELLKVNRAKECKPQTFPLSKTVGDSILRYIRKVRPNNCRHRNIFICRRAPYRPLGATAVYHIVRNRWEGLSVKIKHYGPHSLRHACATHLINGGTSLKEISDYLGHKNIETTSIYAKVNLVELRKVADLDIGGLV